MYSSLIKNLLKWLKVNPFVESASIHKPPMFCGLNYQFWKIRMQIFIESIDKGIWYAITNGPYTPECLVENKQVDKQWIELTDEEMRRAQYDCNAKNITTSSLSMDKFFMVSQCKSAKELWDVLDVTHEGNE